MVEHLENRYTKYNDALIDHVISYHVGTICNFIKRRFDDVEAIILEGSFGKGEGTVSRVRNRLVFLSDYDFVVVTKKPHFPLASLLQDDEIKALERKMRIKISITVFWKPLLRFVPNRISWYDIKFGGCIIYGNGRVLKLIPLRA